MKSTFPLLIPVLAFLSFPLAAGSQSLAAVDSYFVKSPTAIRTEVNGTQISSDFPLFNRIVSRNTGTPASGISLDGRDNPSVLDAYGMKFTGSVYMNQTTLRAPVDFSLCDFQLPFTCQSASFKDVALFSWARFRDNVLFSRTDFSKGAQFLRVAFDSAVSFKFSRYDSNAFYYGSFFRNHVSFNDSRFMKNAAFGFTEFEKSATFNRTEFLGDALFNFAQFGEGADFSNTRFDTRADFSNAVVTGTLDFNGAHLPLFLDMSHMRDIKGTVELMKASSSKESGICRINLLNSDITKFNLDYDKFRLYFPPNTTFDEKVSVYEDLLENFKQRELDDSYRELDIEFSQFKYKEKKQSATNLIQKVWWNYGYDKNMIFSWIFWIILFFTVINTFFIRKLITAITEMPFLSRKTVEKNHLHHPIIAYFLNFPGTFLYTFILIVSGSTGLSIIKDHSKIPNVVWMLYMIILSIVGTGLSIFIFNYIIN